MVTYSVKGCKTDSANASRLASERFLTPIYFNCSEKEPKDIWGREVCKPAVQSKSQGCSLAQDMIKLENLHRPKFIQFAGSDPEKIGNSTAARTYRNKLKQEQIMKQQASNLRFGAVNPSYNIRQHCFPNAYSYTESIRNSQKKLKEQRNIDLRNKL